MTSKVQESVARWGSAAPVAQVIRKYCLFSAVRRGRRVQRGSNRVDEPLFADLSSQVNDCPGMKRGK